MVKTFKLILSVTFFISLSQSLVSFRESESSILKYCKKQTSVLNSSLLELDTMCNSYSSTSPESKNLILSQIHKCRTALKCLDIWYRYLKPIQYKRIHGALPVEWEVEVHEKWENPYKREGFGLLLAEQQIADGTATVESLSALIMPAIKTAEQFDTDSIYDEIKNPKNQLFALRLHLLNLSSIYTTGFECTDTSRIIPELKSMIHETAAQLQLCVNDLKFEGHPFLHEFEKLLSAYTQLDKYSSRLNDNYADFEHDVFILQVNKVYEICANAILNLNLRSQNLQDFSINNKATSLFSDDLYMAQNTWGIYGGITNQADQAEIISLGRDLFFDPILSVNNKRSCASCHKPEEFYTDKNPQNSLMLDSTNRLGRNTPTLLHAHKNHLLMQDGKFYSFQDQVAGVITNPVEMGSTEKSVMAKIYSVSKYKNTLKKMSAKIPGADKPGILHVSSAITSYLGKLGSTTNPFFHALKAGQLSATTKQGFNLFMGKAKCGTCHFFPYFGGSKPPFTSSEFEVIGTATDSVNTKISADLGRFAIHAAQEMKNAFRTPMLLNVAHTAPYMHNGAYKTLDQVLNFYNAGGGNGVGLNISNQTLPADSLRLSVQELQSIKVFLNSLSEQQPVDNHPEPLPESKQKQLKYRKTGGAY